MKTLLIGLLLAASLASTACVGVAIKGSTLAAKSIPRAGLTELAEQGDIEAQYELGRSHCCMGAGFSTQTATEWHCKAAAQRHPGAMFELGRIYLGDISRTPAPLQKVVRMATAKRSEPHAYYWLALAAEQGYEQANENLLELIKDINDADFQLATSMTANGNPGACTYDEVFPRS